MPKNRGDRRNAPVIHLLSASLSLDLSSTFLFMAPAAGHRSCQSASVMWMLMLDRSMHWLCNSAMAAGKRRFWSLALFSERQRGKVLRRTILGQKKVTWSFSWAAARALGRYFSLTKARQGTFSSSRKSLSSNSTQSFPSPMDALSGDNLEQPPGFKEIWLLSRHCILMGQRPLALHLEVTQVNR